MSQTLEEILTDAVISNVGVWIRFDPVDEVWQIYLTDLETMQQYNGFKAATGAGLIGAAIITAICDEFPSSEFRKKYRS